MTNYEMKKLAKELLENHMGYTVPTSRIVPLEFSENEAGCNYLLFKLTTSVVTYAYRNNIAFGKSLVVFKNMDCKTECVFTMNIPKRKMQRRVPDRANALPVMHRK